jgi:hypothetical protein
MPSSGVTIVSIVTSDNGMIFMKYLLRQPFVFNVILDLVNPRFLLDDRLTYRHNGVELVTIEEAILLGMAL